MGFTLIRNDAGGLVVDTTASESAGSIGIESIPELPGDDDIQTALEDLATGGAAMIELNGIVIPEVLNNMTGTETIVGLPFLVGRYSSVSFQNVWDGNPEGVFTFYLSNDLTNDPNEVTHWTLLSVNDSFLRGNPTGIGPGSFGDGFIFYEYRWIRIDYRNISGEGTLLSIMEAKG